MPNPKSGERFFNKIKHFPDAAARYGKLAANYLAFVQLALIRLWLRVNESTAWHRHGTGLATSRQPQNRGGY